MTHQEFIAELAQRLGLTPSKVSDLLDATVCELNERLSENMRVVIPRFGVFETRKRVEHISVNFQTRQRYLVPPSLAVAFKPAPGIDDQPEREEDAGKKITLAGLADLLARRADVSGAEPGVFLKSLFELIPEKLSGEEVVEIKDFGTFRLAPIQTRESAGENSGETEGSSAHSRLGFLPAATLRELVNKPFSHFESILLNEGVAFEGVEEVVEKPAVKEEAYREVDRPDRMASANTQKRSKIPPVWIPIVGGVAIAVASLFFFIRPQTGEQPATITENRPVTDSLQHHFTVPSVVEEIQELPERPERVVVRDGKTLRLIAEETFGSREFWVYIYLKNKDKIKNPNVVSVGTELIIPDSSEYGIDASDPQSIAKAKALGGDFL